MYKAAVIGDRDTVRGFRAVGMDVYTASDGETAGKLIRRLAKSSYAVIYITEALAEACADVLDAYQSTPLPAIIPIPGIQGGTGLGQRRLRKNVEKAVGADILGN